MQNVWNAGIWLLKAGFTLADQVSTVELDSVTGQSQGASSLWSSLVGVAGMIALLREQIHQGRSTPGSRLDNGRESISIHQRVPDYVRSQLR